MNPRKQGQIVFAIVVAVVLVVVTIGGWMLHRSHQRDELAHWRERANMLESGARLTGEQEAELAELRRRIAAAEADGIGR